MTAFARSELRSEMGTILWELRSVNHRYLDIYLRLPEELRALEPAIRERLGGQIRRGKVEGTLRYKTDVSQGYRFTIQQEVARKLVEASREIETLLPNPAPVSALDVLRWPGVLEAVAPELETLAKPVLECLDKALQEFVETRAREGGRLRGFLLKRCTEMEPLLERVRERLPVILDNARERLVARLGEIRDALNGERLEQEVVLFAQKIDVAEELERLAAHLEEVRRVLDGNDPAGRRLDFLMQEMHREANTLGAKSVDLETTRVSVDLKVLIEQMREQIQNVE
jgi:uncharacterized protein (TIGR00255 family)